MQNNLNIRGEPVQSVYSNFRQGKFIVNRRYQRKLVWTLEEKQRFIDSLMNQYPVPLFLGVGFDHSSKGQCFEILDGMQRLEAITSFIDGAYPVSGCYFDLSTIAETNKLVQEGKLIQHEPVLSFDKCSKILNYPLPISTSTYTSITNVDETFRRINTGGVRLSKHEVRQAGAISEFPQLVRKCSIYIRGDASHSDIVDLDVMRSISLTKDDLNYGIKIRNTFWNKCHVMTVENILASRDEEVVAHILLHILLKREAQTSSKFLDEIYTEGTDFSKKVNDQILKIRFENIYKQFCFVFDELHKVIQECNSNLASHLYVGRPNKPHQAFQVLFIAFFNFLNIENKKIQNYRSLANSLKGVASNCMSKLNSDHKWLASDRVQMVSAVSGVIKDHFVPRDGMDPNALSWIENLENILNQSRTENVCYDFKIGLHGLDSKSTEFNTVLVSKIIKTLTAMANSHNGDSYVILGVADCDADANRHRDTYKVHPRKYGSFWITGIDSEAIKYHSTIDAYQQLVQQTIDKEPVSDEVKRLIQRNIIFVKYHEKEVVIMKISRMKTPIKYDNKIYVRKIANTDPNPIESDSEFLFYQEFIEQSGRYPYQP